MDNIKALFGGGENEGATFGSNNYEKKAEIIDNHEEGYTLDDVAQVGGYLNKFMREGLPKAASTAVRTVVETVTPGFVRRMKNAKIFAKTVIENERAIDDIYLQEKGMIEAELVHKNITKEREKMMHEMFESKVAIIEEKRDALHVAKVAATEAQVANFHHRRQLQVEEAKEQEALAKQRALEEKEAADAETRRWRIDFYGEQARVLNEELKSSSPNQLLRQRHEGILNRVKEEWEAREDSRVRLQVEAGSPNKQVGLTRHLGVFAPEEPRISQSRQQPANDNSDQTRLDDDLFVEELDSHEVHLFDGQAPSTAYFESHVQDRNTHTSALQQQEQLAAAVDHELHELTTSLARLQDSRDLLEKEEHQLRQEVLRVYKEQEGPPKRMPLSHEIPATHLFKERVTQVTQQLRKLDYAVTRTQERLEALRGEQTRLREHTIPTLQQQVQEDSDHIGQLNYGAGTHLPIVIGTALHKAPGLATPGLSTPNNNQNSGSSTNKTGKGLTKGSLRNKGGSATGSKKHSVDVNSLLMQPKALLEAIRQQSAYIGIQSEATHALQLHRDNQHLQRDMWVQRLEEDEKKADLEGMISRIAGIAQRLQASKVQNARLNVIDALRAFLASGLKLNVVRAKIVGTLPWFAHIDLDTAEGVAKYVTSNIMGALIFEPAESASRSSAASSASPSRPTTADAQTHDSNNANSSSETSSTDYAQGVTLGEGMHYGVCSGIIQLPKDALWSLSLTITKQQQQHQQQQQSSSTNDNDNNTTSSKHHSSLFTPTPNMDYISVRLGPTLQALQLIGTYRYTINPSTGTVLYDVKHVLHGDRFAFAFEFHASSPHIKHHLAICTGLYEEYTLQDLETLTPDPRHPDRPRVLSSYVKRLRVEETTGGLRETRLLEELIAIETQIQDEQRQKPKRSPITGQVPRNAQKKVGFWDSPILSQTLQRFSREYFLRILKAEILLLQQQKQAQRQLELQQEQQEQSESGTKRHGHTQRIVMRANANLEHEARLEQSQKRYLQKKRAVYQQLINDGRDLVGYRLLVCDTSPPSSSLFPSSSSSVTTSSTNSGTVSIRDGGGATGGGGGGKRGVSAQGGAGTWTQVRVLSCYVDWVENGLVARVLHDLQPYNEAFEDIGPVQRRVQLLGAPHLKYFKAPIQQQHLQQDAQLLQRLREQKKLQDQMHTLENDTAQEVKRLQEGFEAWSRRVTRHMQRHRQRILAQCDAGLQGGSEEAARSKAGRREIQSLLPAAMLDVKKGIILPREIDQGGRMMTQKELAKEAATERFQHRWKQQRRAEVVADLDAQEDIQRSNLQRQQRAIHTQIHTLTTQAKAEISGLKAQLRELHRRHKSRLLEQVKFTPQQFSQNPQVVAVAYNCEHLKTKAWGTLYAHGVRCVQCGVELSTLEEEESQLLGYGSGASRRLWAQTKIHSANEGAFRFADAEELALVEHERIRLEKERRIMDQQEVFFYDFQDLQVIYEFDHRHAREIKRHGVFRQGLQWTEEELAAYEQLQVLQEKQRLEQQGLPETLLADFDPLNRVDDPPPTFRAADERRRAQYRDFCFQLGRLHNFKRKIHDFKLERFGLLAQRDLFATVLEALHRDSFGLELQLQDLEADLDRTAQLLSTQQHMQALWQQASLLQHQAHKDLKRAQMAHTGVHEAVREAADVWHLQHAQTRALLRTKILHDTELNALETQLVLKQRQFSTLQTAYEAVHAKATAMMYLMPGTLIRLQHFGFVSVIAYRVQDDMVLVRLPFGTPPYYAKLFVHYATIVTYERALQQAETRLMEAEDDHAHRLYSQERVLYTQERALMAQEEIQTRRVYAFWDVGQQSAGLRHQMIHRAVHEAQYITQSKRYRVLQQPHLHRMLDRVIEERRQRQREQKALGPAGNNNNRSAASGQKGPQHPDGGRFGRLFSPYARFLLKKSIAQELKVHFVKSAASEADQRVKTRLLIERNAYVRDYQVQVLLDAGVDEVLREIVREALQEGIRARVFAEQRTGIYFNTNHAANTAHATQNSNHTNEKHNPSAKPSDRPSTAAATTGTIAGTNITATISANTHSASPATTAPYMQYGTYNALAALWTARKSYLRDQIEAKTGEINKLKRQLYPEKQVQQKDEEDKEAQTGDPSAIAATRRQRLQQKHHERQLRLAEQRRQALLIEAMYAEEQASRRFYQWELRENLRERRAMAEEEKLMQALKKAELKMRQEAEEALSLITGGAKAINSNLGNNPAGGLGNPSDPAGLTPFDPLAGSMQPQQQQKVTLSAALSAEIAAKRDVHFHYEARRQQLKEITLERRRREEDLQLMAIEDELSRGLREIVLLELQRQKYVAEYGEDSNSEREGEDEEEEEEVVGADGVSRKKPSFRAQLDVSEKPFFRGKHLQLHLLESAAKHGHLKPPGWMPLPPKFENWTLFQRNTYIKRAIILKHKQREKDRKVEKEEKRLSKLSVKSLKSWFIHDAIAQMADMEAELALLEATEALNTIQAQVHQHHLNSTQLQLHCRTQGAQELAQKTHMQRLQQHAEQQTVALQEAQSWYDLCLQRAKTRDKLKRQVLPLCANIDTDSLNGFHQRFETTRLRQRLYQTYFQQIVLSMVNRAEIIASERQMVSLQEQLSRNKLSLEDRVMHMQHLQRTMRCSDWMRMKRSVLNQSFFPKHRIQTLRARFQGWVRYFYWNQGHKEAFTLKYEVIKRQRDLDRQFAAQLTLSRVAVPPPSATSAPVVRRNTGTNRNDANKSSIATASISHSQPQNNQHQRPKEGSAGTEEDDDDLGGTGDDNVDDHYDDDDDDDEGKVDEEEAKEDHQGHHQRTSSAFKQSSQQLQQQQRKSQSKAVVDPAYPEDAAQNWSLISRTTSSRTPLQCQHCLAFYLAASNTSLSCGYHPGRYEMSCPASCRDPGHTPACASHRSRRYTCCLAKAERANGCARRYHIPPAKDPVYEEILQSMRIRDREEDTKLSEAVEKARAMDYPVRLDRAKAEQRQVVEEEMIAKRAVAKRFETLKMV